EWGEPPVWLALSYIDLRQFAKALETLDRIEAGSASRDSDGIAELLLCRTTALRGLGRTNDATACVECFINQYHQRVQLMSLAADIYAQNLQFEGALMFLNALLADDPHDLKALGAKGWAQLELARYDSAIETFGQVIAAAPSDENARL